MTKFSAISTINISMLGELGEQVNKELLWYSSNKDIIDKENINVTWGLNPVSKEVILDKISSDNILYNNLLNVSTSNGYLFMFNGLYHNKLDCIVHPNNKFYDYNTTKYFRPYFEAGIHIGKFLTFKATSHVIQILNIEEYIQTTRERSKEYIINSIKNTHNGSKKLAISKNSFDYEYYSKLASTINLLT